MKEQLIADRARVILASGRSRYDPANLHVLVELVEEQIQRNLYDFDNNLAVLTNYLLYPQCLDLSVCRKILIKAVMQYPNYDFTDCLSQIPEKYYQHKLIANLILMDEYAQTCRFKSLWEVLVKQESILLTVPGLQDSLRRYICEVVSLTYQEITPTHLCTLLHISSPSSSEFDRILRLWGWQLMEGLEGDGVVRVGCCANLSPPPTRDDATAQSGLPTRNIQQQTTLLTAAANARGTSAAAAASLSHRIVDKHMSPDTLKMCFTALSR